MSLNRLVQADLDGVSLIGRVLATSRRLWGNLSDVREAWRGSRSYVNQVAESSIVKDDQLVARHLNYAERIPDALTWFLEAGHDRR
jgi:hypothetical protein